MTAPLVSIIMPVANREKFVAKSISSVLDQTIDDWEMIICDDASRDGTRQVVAGFAQNDPRIRLVENQGRAGPGGARNHACRQARGRWLAFLDSDDIWLPRKLEAFLPAATKAHVMVASDYFTVDHKSGSRTSVRDYVLKQMLPWWLSDPDYDAAIPCRKILSDFSAIAESDTLLAMTIGGGLWMHTSSVMVELKSFNRLGGFNEAWPRVEDFDLWVRLFLSGNVAFVDRPLAVYDITDRETASGERYSTHSRHTPYVDALGHLRLIGKLARLPDLSAPLRALTDTRHEFMHGLCARHATTRHKWIYHKLAARYWRLRGSWRRSRAA